MSRARYAVRRTSLAVLAAWLAASLAAAGPATSAGGKAITLNFPANVQLRIIIEYAAVRLGLNILYDEKIATQTLNMTFKGQLTEADLLPVLRTVLQFRDLSLVPTDTKNVWKIVELKEAGRTTGLATTRPAEAAGQEPLTQLVPLRRLAADQARQLVQPFLGSPQASVVVVPDRNLLLVTDYAANVGRVVDLLAALEKEDAEQEFRICPVRHQDVTAFAKRVSDLVVQRAGTLGLGPPGAASGKVTISPDVPSRSLVIVGPKAGVAAALDLAAQFDVEDRFFSSIRALSHVEAARAEKLIGQLFQSEVKRIEASGRKAVTIDAEGNALVLHGDEAFHGKVKEFLDSLDVPPPPIERTGRVRTVKLYNTKVRDIFGTVQAILAQGVAPGTAAAPAAGTPPAGAPASTGPRAMGGETPAAAPSSDRSFTLPPPRPFGRPLAPTPTATGILSYIAEDIKLVGSEPNNSILISAAPEKVQEAASIIQMLDKRRPQVLIELTLLSIDDSETLNLGTEILTRSRNYQGALAAQGQPGGGGAGPADKDRRSGSEDQAQ